MNDGNIGPNTLETENQQEQEPEQELQYTNHQLQQAFANKMGMLDDGRGSNKFNNKSTYKKGHCTVGVVCKK